MEKLNANDADSKKMLSSSPATSQLSRDSEIS
jgi:hypothetical protein